MAPPDGTIYKQDANSNWMAKRDDVGRPAILKNSSRKEGYAIGERVHWEVGKSLRYVDESREYSLLDESPSGALENEVADDGESKKRILIVDDDRNLALLYQQELTDEGYAVEVVHDGKSAIERVEAGGIDLLVLDIRMPGMDGIEAFSHIIGKHPNFPTIFYTAYSNYKDDFMTWAADAYIIKNPDMTELKDTIRDVFARRETEG